MLASLLALVWLPSLGSLAHAGVATTTTTVEPTSSTSTTLEPTTTTTTTLATTTSTSNIGLVRSLGADLVIDYKKDDFSDVLSGYDVVLNSLDQVTLEKSLKVLIPAGKLISISGPPDVAFARSIGLNWFLQQVIRLLSLGIRRKAKEELDRIAKDGEAGEDEVARAEKELQNLTDRYVHQVDELVKNKEAELLEV